MLNKKFQWRSFLRSHFNGLYIFAFTFIASGIVIFLFLRNTIWQTIAGALFGTGLTILVTTITARRSIIEQYKKEANLQRKTEIYGPLHAELKSLRGLFDQLHLGKEPYPRWIEVTGVERPLSLKYASSVVWPTFSFWPVFRTDYRIDNFSPATQQLLDNVQSLVVIYGNTVEEARKGLLVILRRHIATKLEQEEQNINYKEWLHQRNGSGIQVQNRWFEFINTQLMTTTSQSIPLGKYLAEEWSRMVKWLLADKPDQAATEIYEHDALNWDASKYASFSWFQEIFQATANEFKNDKSYQAVHEAEQKLFIKLEEAEHLLYQGLLEIRDRYEGGKPIV